MTQEDLQKKYDRLFEKVKRVRGWQTRYKKYHIEQDRQLMILNERDLDNMVQVEEVERRQNRLNISVQQN